MAPSSRQKPRFLPGPFRAAATELMSAKALAHYGPRATFANEVKDRSEQPAKTTLFAGGNGADVRKSAAGDFCQ
jgi:hypothetical protein